MFAENTILIIGDSISAGYGIDIQQGWVALLQKKLDDNHYPYRVINDSISGDTTSNGLARLPKSLQQYHPQITIIELGGNDGLRGLSPALIKHNLQKIITLIKESNSKILLLGVRIPPNYGALYTQQFQELFLTLAEENQISVVPMFLQHVDDQPHLMQPDGIHPTAAAQEILLNNVWAPLEKLINPTD